MPDARPYPARMDSRPGRDRERRGGTTAACIALALATLAGPLGCAEGTQSPTAAADGTGGSSGSGSDAGGGSGDDAGGDGDATGGDGDGDATGGDGDATGGDGDGDATGGDGDATGGDGDGDGGGRRKPLTIQGSQVPAPQTQFPVLVDITDADLAAHAGAGGLDIYFEDADGGVLPFERESYDAATGALIAWVKMDLTGEDQDFYLHYGGGTTHERSTPTDVWTHGFAAVYHMDYGGGAGTQTDSTANANHLSPPMASSEPVAAPGQVGDGLSFATANDMLRAPDHGSLDITGALTLSLWANKSATNPNHWETLIAKRIPPGENTNYQIGLGDDGSQRDLMFFDGSTIAISSQTAPAGTWTHMAIVVDAATCSFYMGGVFYQSISSCDLSPNSGPLFVGGTDQEQDEPFYGALDEVRIAGVARSANWLLTEVNNQSGPGFIVVGAEQAL